MAKATPTKVTPKPAPPRTASREEVLRKLSQMEGGNIRVTVKK